MDLLDLFRHIKLQTTYSFLNSASPLTWDLRDRDFIYLNLKYISSDYLIEKNNETTLYTEYLA